MLLWNDNGHFKATASLLQIFLDWAPGEEGVLRAPRTENEEFPEAHVVWTSGERAVNVGTHELALHLSSLR